MDSVVPAGPINEVENLGGSSEERKAKTENFRKEEGQKQSRHKTAVIEPRASVWESCRGGRGRNAIRLGSRYA